MSSWKIVNQHLQRKLIAVAVAAEKRTGAMLSPS
jgi:hypothetical protein